MIGMADRVDAQPNGEHGSIQTDIGPSVTRWTIWCMLAAGVWLSVLLLGFLDAVSVRVGLSADGLRLDPARATAVEWELIPGVGPATARRIVEHRHRQGVESLLSRDETGAERWTLDVVSGIGPITVRRAAPYLLSPVRCGHPDLPAVRP
jgi:hypothetical protein